MKTVKEQKGKNPAEKSAVQKNVVLALLTVLVLALGLMLTACSQEGQGGSQGSEPGGNISDGVMGMKFEDFPILDGSTATLPLARALAEHCTGISQEDAEVKISFSTTDYAYYRLIEGDCDLLIVYEGSQDALNKMEASGLEFEQKVIGYDGLVFLTGEDNPVEGISSEELRMIYSGKITNWNDLGGPDMKIDAYQRNEDSGSQALMRKLVMGDVPLMDAPKEMIPETMGGLIEILAEYENDSNALGYSVYYYVQNMYAVDEIKLLAIDGVKPSNETISDGSYPFINPFYAIIRADEPEDSIARTVYEFLTSKEGRELIEEAGYVSIK